MLIDRYLARYDFNEIHEVEIDASPQAVFTAIKELKISELSPLIFTMLNLRALPARLMGKGIDDQFREGAFLDQLFEGGFIHLGEEQDREIAFGLIGQFWKLDGGPDPGVSTSGGFEAFDDPEYGRVAANLAIVAENGVTQCSTETRIQVRDPKARRKFGLYWRLISMGSGWIRVLWLRAIKRKAESAI